MNKETKNKNEKSEVDVIFKTYQENRDKKIREQIYQKNENLVYFFLSKYKGMPDYEDILQEGKIGLLKAIDKYDPDSGIQFSTFAAHYIKGYAKRCSHSYTSLYIPEYMKWKYKRFLECMDSGMAMQEIMDYTGLKKEEILQLKDYKNLNHLIYMDGSVSQDDDDCNFTEVIHDERVHIEKDVILADVNGQVFSILQDTFDDFSDLQKKILFYHFGLNGYPQLKNTEIAEKLNISPLMVKRTMAVFGRRQGIFKRNIRNRFSIPAFIKDVDIADMLYK